MYHIREVTASDTDTRNRTADVTAGNAMAKRAFDILFGCLALLMLLPLYAAVALLIKLDGPGPIFYRGVRTGRFGKPFRIYKFRTMHVGMEKSGGDTTALGDPRITRIGACLRRYKIDELPQFLNVLLGEMSIVGPRPELPHYTRRYDVEERCILAVNPGITDYSSIEFSALDECVGPNDVDRIFEERILRRKNELRVRYVREQSCCNDVVIILKTVGVLLGKFLKPRRRNRPTA